MFTTILVILVTNIVKGKAEIYETNIENTNIPFSSDLYTVSPDLPRWVRGTTITFSVSY